MNKKSVFISYASSDYSFVEVIKSIIEEKEHLKPLIVANNREAQKPLVEKVSIGIKNADYFIPIITPNSIGAQWINQEIGFSSALNKKIYPIIEVSTLSILKGFIHKEVDQPYIFDSTSQRNFEKIARILIDDITKSEPIPKIVTQTKTHELAQKLKETKDFQLKRNSFKENRNSLQRVKDELYDSMFPYLENQLNEIRITTSMPFENEMISRNFHGYIIKEEGYCFSIVWQPKFQFNIDDSNLIIRFWEGYVSFEETNFAPSEQPKRLLNEIYNVDINLNDQIIWVESNSKNTLSSKDLVDKCFSWLLNSIK